MIRNMTTCARARCVSAKHAGKNRGENMIKITIECDKLEDAYKLMNSDVKHAVQMAVKDKPTIAQQIVELRKRRAKLKKCKSG
jgi:hypothetical protein